MAGEKIINWLREKYDAVMGDDSALLALKAEGLSAYREAIWKKYAIISHSAYTEVFTEPNKWFVGSTINYAEHIFREKNETHPALSYLLQAGEKIDISWQELLTQTTSFADYLNYLGVKTGDIVAGVTANAPEQIMAFLACNSVGAVWTNLHPETAAGDLMRALKPLQPKLLLASESFYSENTQISNVSKINQLTSSLESITQTVVLPSLPPLANTALIKNGKYWNDTFSMNAPALSFKALPYEHPLLITFDDTLQAKYHQQGEVLLNVFANFIEREANHGKSDTFVPKGVAGSLLLRKTRITSV